MLTKANPEATILFEYKQVPFDEILVQLLFWQVLFVAMI